MRAVRVHELGTPFRGTLTETPVPEPGPGEVLIQVFAAPVNYVDWVTLSGGYQFHPPLPYTPGKGPAGIVRGLGAGTEGLEVGTRVLALAEYGGYAELAVAPAAHCYPLADDLSFVDAATLSVAFDTAWISLREQARIRSGESVLVLGASGAVGNAALQLARAMGAGRILAGVSSAGQSEAAADANVDLSRSPLRDTLREQVHALNGGEGVDIVIDPLGGDAFDGALRALAWRGRLVVVGFAAGRIPTLKTNYLMLRNIEVSGIQISDYRRKAPELLRRAYGEIFEFLAAGTIQAPPAETLGLADWQTALERVAGRQARGRQILVP